MEGTDTSKKDIKKVVGFVILAIAVIFFITMLYTKSCTVAEKTKVEEENKKLDDQCPYDQRKVQANNYEQSVAEAKAKSAQAIQDFNSYVKEIKLCSRDDVSPAEMDHVAALEQRIAITRKAFMDAESLGPINNKAIIAYETNLNSISGFNLRIHDVNWRMGWSILGMLGGGGLIMDLDRYFFHD